MLKICGKILSILIWDLSVFKVYKVYISWKSKEVIFWKCCDIKVWKLCDIKPVQVQARSRVYFVWSRYTNIYLDACDRKGVSSKWSRIWTRSLRFTPLCFNASCQITPLLHLCSFIFGLTPFGWLHYFTRTPYFWWECHFWFTYVLFTPTVLHPSS
jgi:hypothetical protein